jgi:hypothetical protein
MSKRKKPQIPPFSWDLALGTIDRTKASRIAAQLAQQEIKDAASDSDSDDNALLSRARPTEYRKFLNNEIVGALPANFIQQEVDNWRDADLGTIRGRMINEVAKKRNSTGAKLDNVSHADNLGSNNLYGPHSYTPPPLGQNVPGQFSYGMNIAPPPMSIKPVDRGKLTPFSRKLGPDPREIGHELLHANDHRRDELNPKVWEHMRRLATTGSTNHAGAQVPMSLKHFKTALGKIRNKIDPAGAFSVGQHSRNYDFTEDYIKKEMEKAGISNNYKIPLLPTGEKDWTKLFDDIHNIIDNNYANPSYRNPGFYFNTASEYPAFMFENLDRKWNTGDLQPDPQSPGNYIRGNNALTEPQALFAYNTLGDMEGAYPAQHPVGHAQAGKGAYPVMNHHIRERRNSIFAAYNPAEAAAEQAATIAGNAPVARTGGWSHGGRVTGKNLLARFIKPKRKAS